MGALDVWPLPYSRRHVHSRVLQLLRPHLMIFSEGLKIRLWPLQLQTADAQWLSYHNWSWIQAALGGGTECCWVTRRVFGWTSRAKSAAWTNQKAFAFVLAWEALTFPRKAELELGRRVFILFHSKFEVCISVLTTWFSDTISRQWL